MKLIMVLMKGNAFLFLSAITLSVLSAFCGIAVISFINDVVSGASINANNILALFGLIFSLFILSFCSQSMLTSLGHKVVYRLRLLLSRRLMNTSVERLDLLGQPAILASLTKDVASISQAFNSLPFVVFGLAVLVSCYGYLLHLSPPFFFCTVVMTLLSVLIGKVLMTASRGYKKRVRDNDDFLYESYEGLIKGRNELKLSKQRREVFYHKSMVPVVQHALDLETKADRLTVLNGSWVNSSILLLIAMVVLLYAQFNIGTREDIAGFALAILFLRSPLAGLVGSLPTLLQGSVAYTKIQKLSLAEPDAEMPFAEGKTKKCNIGKPTKYSDNWGSLVLDKVYYQYPSEGGESGFCVGPIDFQLNQGELVFWVGGNGTGKSTCARLVTGLYAPQSGSVQFAGEYIDNTNIDFYLSHFSVVFADFYLFKELINEAGERPDTELVEHYLQALSLEKKVNVNVDGKLNTTKLSQGQRKRLALLLAYLENRSIIVLDEWAADQDPVFRKVFYTELLPELKARGKTVIAITHDDHYFHIADKVYRIDEGKITPFFLETAENSSSFHDKEYS
ncbi:cyclic peptide export ABC transporter [Marinomonas rhizomae]|uniref:cyclic peptide export ABC transporter n=1 Tax=Marinomonas rhizomae TaxID=491948 RepID=UPI0021058530|nr:cyclic peptide export ABC transporter [Marinomonas rhizomae]UTV98067.1 cyclic peptide export ABC transporter [Marinomonas rhizomae]